MRKLPAKRKTSRPKTLPLEVQKFAMEGIEESVYWHAPGEIHAGIPGKVETQGCGESKKVSVLGSTMPHKWPTVRRATKRPSSTRWPLSFPSVNQLGQVATLLYKRHIGLWPRKIRRIALKQCSPLFRALIP